MPTPRSATTPAAGSQSDDAGPTPSFEVRRATPDTLMQFLSPLLAAFAGEAEEQELEDEREVIEPDRTVAAFDGDRPVGVAAALSFRLTVPGGGQVGAAGITLVGTLPSHRRQGVLRLLMAQLVADARERKEPVAILWASEAAIYQRFGFGPATVISTFDLERSRAAFLRPVARSGRIRLMERDEAVPIVASIYERARGQTPGTLARSEPLWRIGVLNDAPYSRKGTGPKFRAVHEDESGVADAYVIYRVKGEWDDQGPKGELIVVDWAAIGPEAERQLWSWVLDVDLISRIKGWRQPVPHPLQLHLAEPRRLALTIADALWLRVIDLPAALTARSYAAAGSIVLDVRDDYLPDNAGRWQIDAAGTNGPGTARARVARTERAADVSLGASELGAVYLGGWRFADLAATGRATESRPGGIRDSDALFATERPPYCSTAF